jgi:opacity protein-like surface antigen
MRTVIITAATLAATLATTAAFAADLRVFPALKAQAYVPPACTAGGPMTATSPAVAPSCSGFYAGFNIQGIGSNLDILGSGINNSVFAGGGFIGGTAGYQFWNGQFFLAGEVNGGINVNPGGVAGAVGSHSLEGNVLLKAGVGLSNLIGIGQPGTVGAGTPSQGINLAVIPGTALMSPYAVIGDSFKQGGNGWTMGAGTMFILAQGWNLDVYYHRINWNDTQTSTIPGATISTVPAENRVGVAFLKMF